MAEWLVCVCVFVLVCMWRRSEYNLQELVLSFHRVSPQVGIQVIRIGSKHLYPFNNLQGLTFASFEV